MISADDVRACVDRAGIASLFRRLGYPVAPVILQSEECRRAAIRTPWNGCAELYLLARAKRLDVLLLEGEVSHESIQTFMRDYAEHNSIAKTVLLNIHNNDRLSIFGLSDRKALLRLDVNISEPSRHAIDRLNLLAVDGLDERSSARIVQRALDRAAVTRQFFLRFRNAVDQISGGEAPSPVRDHALLILSRLLFLSFIQEKGWLNGERRFLIDRAERCVREGREFFTTVLVPLFFGCLNTPGAERDAVAGELGRIPYLNGGLFEPSPYERRRPDLSVPNDVMLDVLENVFERFDFTVDEGDSAATKVDPEMLGRVFESLMAEDERAASGSFYSPKEIVDALTARAIAEWLSPDDADAIVAICRGNAPPRSLHAKARSILDRLETITVLDPACGSGAFLLSALDVIERITIALSDSPPADLRQRIVERSLFGVDVKAEAVRLCELRLWLAIVSTNAATPENIRPLPNLDRNVLQGNSLLGPLDFFAGGRGDVYREWSYGLRAQSDLVARYRCAPRAERPALYRLIRLNDQRLATDLVTRAIESDEKELERLLRPDLDLFGQTPPIDRMRCDELQERIATNRRTLEQIEEGSFDFFSFDVHFAPVISTGGFDVVLGNPPWVRHERIEPVARRMYRDRYALFGKSDGVRGVHQPDLSVAFFERAVSLAAPGGVISMLMPSKIANAGYAARLRQFIESDLSMVAVHDWTDERRRLFDADTFPLGLTVRRAPPSPDHVVSVATSAMSFTIEQRRLAGAQWTLVPPAIAAVLLRLRSRFTPLEQTLGRRPLMGVKTGSNRRFFLEGSVKRGSLVTTDGISIPLRFACRVVRGRNVRRWSCEASEWMLWPPRDGWRELPPWLQQLALSHRVEPQALRLSFVRPEHVGIKVAWKDVSRGMAATVLPDSVSIAGRSFPLIPNQTLYSIDCASLDEAYAIAAVLNSTVADALLLATAERAKDDHFRFFGNIVAALPCPRIDNVAKVVRLSRNAHRLGRASDALDRAVAELYGVTDHELTILREYVERMTGAR